MLMKRYKTGENVPVNKADETADVNSVLENISPVNPGTLDAQPGVILNLYGMNLRMDETAGKLIITNSILKNAPVLNFIEIKKDNY